MLQLNKKQKSLIMSPVGKKKNHLICVCLPFMVSHQNIVCILSIQIFKHFAHSLCGIKKQLML